MHPEMPSDSEESVFAPERLASLIEAARGPNGIWRADELDAVWGHQLDAPLEYELGGLHTGSEELRAFGTFRLLLHASAPPLDLLRAIKLYAKTHKQDIDSPLPPEIANALYFITIAAGIASHGCILGPLSTQAVESGFRWCLEQSWLDRKSKELVNRSIRRMSDPLLIQAPI